MVFKFCGSTLLSTGTWNDLDSLAGRATVREFDRDKITLLTDAFFSSQCIILTTSWVKR